MAITATWRNEPHFHEVYQECDEDVAPEPDEPFPGAFAMPDEVVCDGFTWLHATPRHIGWVTYPDPERDTDSARWVGYVEVTGLDPDGTVARFCEDCVSLMDEAALVSIAAL